MGNQHFHPDWSPHQFRAFVRASCVPGMGAGLQTLFQMIFKMTPLILVLSRFLCSPSNMIFLVNMKDLTQHFSSFILKINSHGNRVELASQASDSSDDTRAIWLRICKQSILNQHGLCGQHAAQSQLGPGPALMTPSGRPPERDGAGLGCNSAPARTPGTTGAAAEGRSLPLKAQWPNCFDTFPWTPFFLEGNQLNSTTAVLLFLLNLSLWRGGSIFF